MLWTMKLPTVLAVAYLVAVIALIAFGLSTALR